MTAFVCAAGALTAALVVDRPRATASPTGRVATPAPGAADAADVEHDEEPRTISFRMPTGEPSALSCDEARLIVAQVRDLLAYEPRPVAKKAFAESTVDWLDPHGLWALSTDAPTKRAFDAVSSDLLRELEGKRTECEAATKVGVALEGWVKELRVAFDKGRVEASATEASLIDPIPAHGSGLENAREIGRRVGAFERRSGPGAKAYGDAARARFFPELDRAGWAKVVLASAVRAYVPLADAHSAWAPFDEEASISDVDLVAHPPPRLWTRPSTTAMGALVEGAVVPPLKEHDVLLGIAGVKTAALPVEQLEQMAYAALEGRASTRATVLRDGAIVEVELPGADTAKKATKEREPLPTEQIPYADGAVLTIKLAEVRDDLGEDLTAAIKAAKREPRRVLGVVLDLRGNGGGSAEGAVAAVSVFLPNVPLFPTKRRDGTVEIDRTREVAPEERWDGPVVSLVDGATASAAEMIAGGLGAYGRGVVLGATTFGKGCEQEYVDDDARAGVLRLTTLLYALPDGSPVQRTGLEPHIRYPFTPREEKIEREDSLAAAPPSWRGPDVRAKVTWTRAIDWPLAGSTLGPCKDPDVCKALRLLGGPPHRSPSAKH
ncbi:MAG: hypothetical protein JNL38_21700 [Myxococcales bacterium]|nr:hypothetical protein [Myxococcales bacterium]